MHRSRRQGEGLIDAYSTAQLLLYSALTRLPDGGVIVWKAAGVDRMFIRGRSNNSKALPPWAFHPIAAQRKLKVLGVWGRAAHSLGEINKPEQQRMPTRAPWLENRSKIAISRRFASGTNSVRMIDSNHHSQ